MLRHRTDSRRVLLGGVVAGLVGGVVLGLYMLLMNLAQGQEAWLGTKLAGAPFLGDRATQPGFDALAVAVGIASHLAVSIGWGLLFGLVFFGLSRSATVWAGALWGFVVWLGMFYLILPAAGLSEMARSMPVGPVIIEHVLFGLAVSLGFLPFQEPVLRLRVPPRIERPIMP